MTKNLIEENGGYFFDCNRALWCSGDMHDDYRSSHLQLSDADFIIETDDRILLVEYKNACIPQALSHVKDQNVYNPFHADKYNKIVRKFYDSLHYLRLIKKLDKPVHYVFVLEYPKDNSVLRRKFRERLQKSLPFELQRKLNTGIQLIASVSVVNIEEWNQDKVFGMFPIRPV